MKLTNSEVVNMINALAGMQDKVLPRKLSYAISKNLEKLQATIYKPYDKERINIIRKYAVLDENGNQKADVHGRLIYTDREAYENEMDELLEIENEFDMHTIGEELLDQCEKEEKYTDLSVKEYAAIMKMLK